MCITENEECLYLGTEGVSTSDLSVCSGRDNQGLPISVPLIHNHRRSSANPTSSKFGKPKPPKAVGLHTLDQASRHCPQKQ
jgi:hypothetical protein